ncbi:hypothetical protein FACS1894186_3620 [Alphaproteobacteria bacterium]|nr:hypothetical protein FACS1894186_3620 [Alphaproteobacteria bacterium]
MLTALHRISDTWIFKGILALTALSFMGLWGIGGLASLEIGQSAIATVGMQKITPEQVAREIDRQLSRLRAVMPDVRARDMADLGLVGDAVNRKVYAALIDQGAIALNLGVSDDVLRMTLYNAPEFQTRSGEFDRALFSQMVSRLGMKEAEYLGTFRSQMAGAFIMAPAKEAKTAPALMLKLWLDQAASVRTVEVFEPRAVAPEPTAAEIKEYYDSHAEAFRLPQYRRLTVLHLPETVPPEVENAIGEGQDLADIARQFSLKTVALTVGPASRDLPPEVIAAAFATPRGRLSDFMAGMVFRVDEIIEPTVQPLDKARAKIVDLWKTERRASANAKLAQTLMEQLAAGKKPELGARKLEVGAGTPKGADADLALRAKTLAVGEAAVVARGTGPVVIRVAKSVAGKMDEPERVRATADLARGLADDMAGQLLASLSAKVKVQINDAAVAELNARYSGADGE